MTVRAPGPPARPPVAPSRPPQPSVPRYVAPATAYPSVQTLPPRSRPPRHSPIIAPTLALVGLLLIAAVTVWGFTFIDQNDGSSPVAGALLSPAPAASVEPGTSVVPPTEAPPTDDPEFSMAPVVAVAPVAERPDIKGSIVFSRGGDLWAASGVELRKLTSTGSDTAPTWSGDGKYIYYVHTEKRTTSKTREGGLYTFFVPNIYRIDADGSNRKKIYDSLIKGRGGQWFSYVLQPDVSPDGKTLAVVSDGPNPNSRGEIDPVVLYMLSTKPNGKLRKVATSSLGTLGHNDPEWSPDGRRVAFTRNRKVGESGVPTVAILTCKSKNDCTSGRTHRLRPGYASPSWSPDGTWMAVEATRGLGRDIVIVNADRGDPRITLTDDGNSFAPVVSPDGDQIAYLHRDGLDIDLRVMTLDIDESGKITLINDQAVTVDGAIDGSSPPAWYIPRADLVARGTDTQDAVASEAPSDG